MLKGLSERTTGAGAPASGPRRTMSEPSPKESPAPRSPLNRLAGAYEEVAALQSNVLTNAQRAFETAYQGYEEGKFDYLYVLDTQRTLFETRAQYIDAVETYHKTRAQAERLMGRGIDAIEKEQKQTGGPPQ